jgi:hypothetical protein
MKDKMTEKLKSPVELMERLEDQAKVQKLRDAIAEGDASGIAKGDVFARIRKQLKLSRAKRARRDSMK